MSLEAVIQQEQPTAADKTIQAGQKGLEVLVNTGINAVHAANPIRDAKNFAKSAYHLVKDKLDWKEYKAGLKKGKFLGKGNLANVLFTTGIVASGMYPALLGLRAGIGATSYIGKRALTTDKIKKKIVNFCDKHKTKFSRLGKTFLGIPRYKIENYLSKYNVQNEINKLKDDTYYRQKVMPAVMDAAIAAKGYAGIVGFKWLAKALDKTASKIEKNSGNKYVKGLARRAAKIGGFAKNASGDLLSAMIFASGANHLYETGALERAVNGEMYKDVKEKVNYVSSGEATRDVQAYFSQHQYADDIVETVNGTASEVANYVKAKFQSTQESVQQAAAEVVNDSPVAAVINPEEKYAVLVAGYDAEHTGFFGTGPKTNERFLMEQCKVYHDLLEMGFEPENIRVLIPGGLDPKHSDSHYPEGWEALKKAYADDSYSHDATEDNLERVLRGMSGKVDGNDTFMFYMTTHGNEGLEFDDATYKFKRPSYAAINNGRDDVHDYELADYCSGIEGGKEIYFIDSCHSGGFAKEIGRGDDICITACKKDQPAVMHMNGDSLGSYFVEEMKQNGGIDNDTSYGSVKENLKSALRKFKSTWGRYDHTAQEQTPVVGSRNYARNVLRRAA